MLERMNAVAAMWLARIAAAVIACLALMTFADVFARYVFNSPFSFTIELTEAAMGVIVFFGLALVTHEDGHISVDIVTSRLRARLRAALGLLMQAIALAYLALLVWRLWIRALELYDFGDTTQILLMKTKPK